MSKTQNNNIPLLSPREREVLQYISQGLSSKLIACKLFVALSTVNGHRASMLRKTGAANTTQLVALYKDFL